MRHLPTGATDDADLRVLVERGLVYRFSQLCEASQAFDAGEYRSRCDAELAVLGERGFATYFLVAWDLVQWARERGILVGPGRGPGVGSVVAWALRITNVDPIAYDLSFERFINPERHVRTPHLDVEVCARRRREVFAYLRDKYGSDRVGRIHDHRDGIVITARPLQEYVPCHPDTEDGLVTEVGLRAVEAAGLTLFNIFGLKALTGLSAAIQSINSRRVEAGEPPLDIALIPHGDAGVYAMLA